MNGLFGAGHGVTALENVYEKLIACARRTTVRYRVPSLWCDAAGRSTEAVQETNPFEFYLVTIEDILRRGEAPSHGYARGSGWTRTAVVYNMFVRQTAAWDHDGDGRVGIDVLPGGFRETGTFLKATALLPRLREMGVDTVSLLPVTEIGCDGRKGSLGSPYAIRNPFHLDARLAEPWLGLDVETECAAFVEAAHRLGMKVVFEFVFRTAAKDSDWVPVHPEWFYWIDESVPDCAEGEHASPCYGAPRFTDEELRLIQECVRNHAYDNLPKPPAEYRRMFADSPEIVEMSAGRYIGITREGRRVRIPGAFADWPPDDVQPPWDDVTYLKLYDNPDFNYIAYNTIRIYDNRLAREEYENRELWNTILDIIPFYQQRFGIDGVMIDMGHALPKKLKQAIVDRARAIDPDFAFWEENFAVSVQSREEGYDAVVGYLPFDIHQPHKLREFLYLLSQQDVPIPFFAAVETHNTPRAASRPGGHVFAKMAFAFSAFLPAVLFIHQGEEVCETLPVNTGLGFSREEAAVYLPDRLPLFSESCLCWDNPSEITSYITAVTSIRARWKDLVIDPRHETFEVIPSEPWNVLGYRRVGIDHAHGLLVLANTDCSSSSQTTVPMNSEAGVLLDALTGTVYPFANHSFTVVLDPGQVLVVPLSEPLS
ncbi:MAG: alpha-amylase [Bacteroidota bacterium]|nr:alpha-amylase [Bacteroidota bacterium]